MHRVNGIRVACWFTMPAARLEHEIEILQDLATRLQAFLNGRTMSYGAAGEGMGVNPNSLRYAAATGTVLIRWEGPPGNVIQRAWWSEWGSWIVVLSPD